MASCYTVAALIDHLRDFPQDAPVYIQSDSDSPTRPMAGPFMNPPGFESRVTLIGQWAPVDGEKPVPAGMSGEADKNGEEPNG